MDRLLCLLPWQRFGREACHKSRRVDNDARVRARSDAFDTIMSIDFEHQFSAVDRFERCRRGNGKTEGVGAE